MSTEKLFENWEYQIIETNEKVIVLSVLDEFAIGTNTNFGEGSSEREYIFFTENLIISDFEAKTISISTNEFSASQGSICTSGKNGKTDNTPNMDQPKGNDGENGVSGGKINLYYETPLLLEEFPLTIKAKGGNGSDGQNSIEENLGGGNGGDGGGGGEVTVFYSQTYYRLFHYLLKAYQAKSIEEKNEFLEDFYNQTKGLDIDVSGEKIVSIVDKLKKGQEEEQTDVVNSLLREVGKALKLKTSIWEQDRLLPKIYNQGGNYGTYGTGNPNGKNGESGKEGVIHLIPFAKTSELVKTPKEDGLFCFAHPTQCSMLLQKAQFLYREADPVDNREALEQTIDLLNRLVNRTKIFSNLQEDSALAEVYKANEKNIGAINSVGIFKNIYKTADSLLGQIRNGDDYYGNSYNFVPLASFSFYSKILDKQINDFGVIENTFLHFFNVNCEEQERLQDLRAARSYLKQIKQEADSQIKSLKARVENTAKEIAALQNQYEAKKEIVKQKMEEFKDAMESSWYFDLKSLFSSLTTLAFLGASTTGWVIAGSEISYSIYEGAKQVTDDRGVPVQKDYLVSKIKAVEGDLDSKSLSEQYKKLDDGTIEIDDPGANKLIAEQNKVNSFLEDFYMKFPDKTKALKDAFQDYVNLILTRNNKIIYYNSMITLIIKDNCTIKASQQKREILNEENLRQYQPILSAFTTLMRDLYYTAQSQVMKSLYLTERAFRFWSLSDEKPVTKILNGKKIPNINIALLKEAQSTILQSYAKTVENYGMNAQVFPANEEKNGVFWQLAKSDVDTLKEEDDGEYSVMFQIPTATEDSKKEENVFAGFADVRLTKVRVWIDGIETSDNELSLTNTHTGNEKIVSRNDDEFSFRHESKKISFKYNWKNKEIFEDGDIGYKDKEAIYALVGPFTWWHLIIRNNDNKGLDLSNMTGVRLEFCGTNYAFV